MDYWERRKRFDKIALQEFAMLGSSVAYLYRHATLFAVAFISATFVAVQNWYASEYNGVATIIVMLSRILLLALILTTLTGHPLKNILERSYWNETRGRVKATFRNEWSKHRLMTGLLLLVILIISLGNFLVIHLTNLAAMVLPTSKPEAVPAIRSFLNNISIIPIAAIFAMMLLGVHKPDYSRKVVR